MIDLRQAIVDEAVTWLRTPWHHQGRVKGAGIDCGMFLLEVFEAVGLIPHIVPPHYGVDFMMHRQIEWFLETVAVYADEIEEVDILPGDVLLYKHGRIFSHGAIVEVWPRIVHASVPDRGVCYGDASKEPLKSKEKKIFRHRALA